MNTDKKQNLITWELFWNYIQQAKTDYYGYHIPFEANDRGDRWCFHIYSGKPTHQVNIGLIAAGDNTNLARVAVLFKYDKGDTPKAVKVFSATRPGYVDYSHPDAEEPLSSPITLYNSTVQHVLVDVLTPFLEKSNKVEKTEEPADDKKGGYWL